MGSPTSTRCYAQKMKKKRVFGLVIDFGTSQSPKSTRPLITCRVPSDHIPKRSYPLFRTRQILQACLRPRDIFWDIPVPKIDSAFDNLFVPQPSWSPSTTQQLPSSLLLRTCLPMTGRRVRRPTLFSLWRKARRENSAASRLLGSTSLRFALHGCQRLKAYTPSGLLSDMVFSLGLNMPDKPGSIEQGLSGGRLLLVWMTRRVTGGQRPENTWLSDAASHGERSEGW